MVLLMKGKQLFKSTITKDFYIIHSKDIQELYDKVKNSKYVLIRFEKMKNSSICIFSDYQGRNTPLRFEKISNLMNLLKINLIQKK
jgi:hypothetical protein